MSNFEWRLSGMSSVSFAPEEYVSIAFELATEKGTEAAFRAAVGRAYYVCFLLVHLYTQTPRVRDVHKTVIKQLLDDDYVTLANALNHMRELREVADYQLTPQNPDHADWEQNWMIVRRDVDRILPEIRALLGRSTPS